ELCRDRDLSQRIFVGVRADIEPAVAQSSRKAIAVRCKLIVQTFLVSRRGSDTKARRSPGNQRIQECSQRLSAESEGNKIDFVRTLIHGLLSGYLVGKIQHDASRTRPILGPSFDHRALWLKAPARPAALFKGVGGVEADTVF